MSKSLMRLRERFRKKSCCRCFRPSTASIWLPERVRNRRFVRHSKFSIHLIWFCSRQEKYEEFQMVTMDLCIHWRNSIHGKISWCTDDKFHFVTRRLILSDHQTELKNCRLVDHSKFSIHLFWFCHWEKYYFVTFYLLDKKTIIVCIHCIMWFKF